jgi:long-chain acyl-CoA synthetase
LRVFELPHTVSEFLSCRYREAPGETVYFERKKEDGWRAISWDEHTRRTRRLAAALRRLGLQTGDRLAVLAPTSPAWLLLQDAAMNAGLVCVGIDPLVSPESLRFSLETIRPSALVIVGERKVAGVPDMRLLRWSELVSSTASGEELPPQSLSPSDPALVVFTSGTTGEPKAISYTHGQVMLACREISRALPSLGNDDLAIAWLPMANLFQRMMNLVAMARGVPFHVLEDPARIYEEVLRLSPSFLIGVPRFCEKLAAGGRQAMGTRLRLMITGSAATKKEVLEHFQERGVLLLEAYGVSENLVPVAMNRVEAYRFGSVGRPLDINQIRIRNDGEILVRGPGVFDGAYLGDTATTLTAEGFYPTGDFGRIDEAGYLYLEGRKSDLIKSSNGRKIAPRPIEEKIERLPGIDRAVVIGNERPFLVALISPRPGAPADLAQSVLRELEEVQKDAPPYERVRAVAVLEKPFSVEGGELTSNLKLRRRFIEEKYRDRIADLIANLRSSRKAA